MRRRRTLDTRDNNRRTDRLDAGELKAKWPMDSIAIPLGCCFIVAVLIVLLCSADAERKAEPSEKTDESSVPDDDALTTEPNRRVEETTPAQAKSIESDQRGHTRRERPPSWMFPAGVAALVVGPLAFVASAATGASHAKPGTADSLVFCGALLDGLLNPLFFIGCPLGLYWCIREREPRLATCHCRTTTIVLCRTSRTTRGLLIAPTAADTFHAWRIIVRIAVGR